MYVFAFPCRQSPSGGFAHVESPVLVSSAVSNQNNKARLQLLEKREELLEQVFEEAKSRIGEVTKDEKKYQALLKDLILQVRPVSSPFRIALYRNETDCVLPQALYTMMEKDIQVSGRPKDQSLLKKAADEAASEFEEKIGFKVKIEVDEELGDKS